MNWMVRQSTELEVNMNACERVIEFTNLTPERPPIVPGELRNKQEAASPCTVQNIQLGIAWLWQSKSPSDKSGVVGRTGEGGVGWGWLLDTSGASD